MSDRWSATEDGKGWQVERNGRWYSDAHDEQDAIGMARSMRAEQIVLIDALGYRRVLKLKHGSK